VEHDPQAMSEGRQVSYLPALDGLRAIAVLLVIWAHVDPTLLVYPDWLKTVRFWTDPGVQGVDLFFVLSGFLITRILLSERARGVPLRCFMLRRLLRIFPIYYLLLLVMTFLHGGSELWWCALYLSNFHFALQGGGGALEHTWSLCVEEHFYILWPPLVALGASWLVPRVLWLLPLGAAAAIWWIYRELPAGHWPDAVYYLSPIRFCSLAAGCLMAYGEARLRDKAGCWLIVGVGLLVVGAVLMPGSVVRAVQAGVLPASLLQPEVAAYTPVVQLLSAMSVSTGLMLCCIVAGNGRPLGWLRMAPLRAIGRISYGLYLYHWPIFVWVFGLGWGGWGIVVALAAAGACATLSYLVIERPILRFGTRFR
jgi:peptidoglycan/LPS O-acetylase OafA/YrhL